MPYPRSIEPDRALVLRIVQEEALASRVTLTDILDMHVSPEAVAARVRCWKRIMKEADCGTKGLARVWGCSPEAVRSQLYPKPPKPAPSAPTASQRAISRFRNDGTWDRLAFQYGPDRADSIAAGKDRLTNLDVARWDRLCARAG